jgi:iron complex outermembrane receptor protein
MKLKTIVRAIALLGVAAPLAAFSQDAAQRVEITGSSIKRIASEGALPVQVISRKDLENQGLVTAEQVIASLSVNGNGLDNLASNADVVSGAARGNNGASAANLRGQGASSTLILLNGRRVAAHGLNGGVVDLNSIPMAAVERIEVLKDGASAVYGTDAVGGVINFILRKDFNGVQAQAFTDITQQGGGNISRVNLTAGTGDLDKDRYNVLVALSRSENQALRGDQRDFVNTFQSNRGLSVDTRGTPFATVVALSGLPTALSNASSSGPKLGTASQTYNSVNVLNLPGGAGCDSIPGQAAYDAALWLAPASKYACAWDTGRAAVLQQPVTNTNLVARGTLRLGEHQVYGEVTAARVESAKSFSPSQISSSATKTVGNGLAAGHGLITTPNPFYNLAYPSTGASYNFVLSELQKAFPLLADTSSYTFTGKPLAFRWRCMPCGNRELQTTSDTSRFLLAADGPLAMGWDYKAGLSYASSSATSLLGNGYYYGDKLAGLLNTGVLNPFLLAGQSQTPAALSGLAAASAKGVTLYGGKYTVMQADASATGSLFKLPAGDVLAAVGVDARTEKYSFNGSQNDFVAQVNIPNAPFDALNTLDTVKRDIKAVYAEVLVPVVKNLELTLAARRDDYSDFGATTNPKVSLRFSPINQLVFRGSYNTSFRVPLFNQLYNGITESPTSGATIFDPSTCATLKVDATKPGCASINPNTLFGGVPTLTPETSKQWNGGFVWAPSASYSLGADWWSIDRTNNIQALGLADFLNNYALFQDRFKRDNAGKLVQIDTSWVNTGGTLTKGVDVSASAAGRVFDGKWGLNLEGSYLLEKKSKLVVAAPWGASEVAQFTRSGDLGLRWKHTLTGSYAMGNWSGTLSQQYRSGYKDYQLPGVANGSVVPPDWNPNVKAYTLYNTSVSYTGVKNLGLTFGIKNLFNTDPPFAAAYDTNSGAGSSWEPRVADPRGRAFTFLVDYKFK